MNVFSYSEIHGVAKAEVPAKGYQIIYADPPWSYEGGRGTDGLVPYRTTTMRDLKNIKVPAAETSVLFMWAVQALIPEALALIKAWNFEFQGIVFCWIKTYKHKKTPFFGCGSYTRANCELLLYATRGVVPARLNVQETIAVQATRLGHSVKPSVFREKIDSLFADLFNEKLEMFARTCRGETWHSMGDEVMKYAALDKHELSAHLRAACKVKNKARKKRKRNN